MPVTAPVLDESPSRIAVSFPLSVRLGLALELPNNARTNEDASPVLLPPLEASSATVDPVTCAFLPMTAAVLSVKFVPAVAELKSKPPPLSDLARFVDIRNVSGAS